MAIYENTPRYKYVVFKAKDTRGIMYYVFGTFGKHNVIIPLFSFYNKNDLWLYVEEYNREDILILIKE